MIILGSHRRIRRLAAISVPRRGTALVEFAVVLPLLFMLVFGIVEVGRAVTVQQIIVNGAREGARAAVMPKATDSEVHSTIDGYLTTAGITGFSRQISPSLSGAGSNVPITVTITVPYNNISWLPVGSLAWFGGSSLSASCVMRREP